MHIMVVDDSKVMRNLVLITLQQAGYGDHNFTQAGSGVEALDLIHLDVPDLILCDWNMPEMSGLELLEKLKSEGKNINFGFVTSEGTDDMKQIAIQAGALFVITKPFTPDTFQETLKDYIQ